MFLSKTAFFFISIRKCFQCLVEFKMLLTLDWSGNLAEPGPLAPVTPALWEVLFYTSSSKLLKCVPKAESMRGEACMSVKVDVSVCIGHIDFGYW